MAMIKFLTKEKSIYRYDDTLAYKIINVPVFTRKHCDMDAFRKHPKYGGLANSDLFPNVLSRIKRDVFNGKDYFRTDKIPDGVKIENKGFMTEVSFEA